MNKILSRNTAIIKLFIDDIRIPAAFLSFIIAYWEIFLYQSINLDGIFYLKVANLLFHGKWIEAFHQLPWLIYPSLIAALSKVTGLGLENSAHLLTALFSAALTYVFITLVRDLGGNSKTLIAAAFVITLHPEFNESRDQLLRDHGYWVFYLTSILFFIRYYKEPTIKYSIFWCLNILMASLFRIEGIVFLLFLPLVLLFHNLHPFFTRIQYVIKAYLLSIILLISCLLYFIINPKYFSAGIPRLIEFFSRFDFSWKEFTLEIAQKSEVVGTTLLNNYSEDYALAIILVIPGIILIDTLIKSITPIYSLILIWSPFSKCDYPKREGLIVFSWVAVLNIGLLIAFIFHLMFLQDRYTYPLVLTLLPILPFVFVRIYDRFVETRGGPVKKRFVFYLIFLLLLVNSLEGIISAPGRSKQYIKEAGYWLNVNMDEGKRLCTNNVKISHYSERIYDSKENINWIRQDVSETWLDEVSHGKCDYYAVWIKKRNEIDIDKIPSILEAVPIQEFSNKKKDAVLIYKKNNPYILNNSELGF